MKVVILSSAQIPDFNVYGPILSPAEYDIHQILRWIHIGIDVREVMPDGSYRKLKHNDEKLMELLNQKVEEQMKKRKEREARRVQGNITPSGTVKVKPEKRKRKPVIKQHIIKKEEPKLEPVVEEVVQEEVVENIEIFIDELEKPE